MRQSAQAPEIARDRSPTRLDLTTSIMRRIRATPRLPQPPLKRRWPFLVGENYLGGMPGEADIIGRFFPSLCTPQVWGDCCAYVAQPAPASA